MRYFEDYRVGETFRSKTHTLTPDEIDAFVRIIGVSNPLFLDEKHAAKGPFGQRIAPGFLTISLALGLLYEPKIIQYFLLLRSEADFLKPLKVGDTIRVVGKVTRKHTEPNRKAGELTLRTHVINQDREDIAKMALTISMLKRRYAPREPVSRRGQTQRHA